MAKTGSGKTACFLIPLLERLRERNIKTGARALILSPTRELAIQTYKFIKELGHFLNLKTILVMGGDSMDTQFASIHTFPDVVVATPGRFLHLCVEMDLKLTSIEYLVFDEADRLFEMGFGEQLNDILKRLPDAKQMVMFSATLPKLLVDFAKAGLSDPALVRLDVENKIPSTLQLKFLFCRPDERYAALLTLLKYVMPAKAQTVVFAGTQHHVELISHILTKSNISNTFVYSALDASARKINTAKFVQKKASVLVVTDIAARGIDIPNLDFVINLHFPGKPKLFIHRVGRCARAGKSGTAYSIFSTDDEGHLLDLHQFFERPFDIDDTKNLGILPSDLIEEEHQTVMKLVKDNDLANIFRVSNNAYKQYIATRPSASGDANRRAKTVKFHNLKVLDDFADYEDKDLTATEKKAHTESKEYRVDFLSKMKTYRPQAVSNFCLFGSWGVLYI
jgi:ATP-dependent RNA helicase DDX54/DBP10